MLRHIAALLSFFFQEISFDTVHGNLSVFIFNGALLNADCAFECLGNVLRRHLNIPNKEVLEVLIARIIPAEMTYKPFKLVEYYDLPSASRGARSLPGWPLAYP